MKLFLTLFLLIPLWGIAGEAPMPPPNRIELRNLGYPLPQPILNRVKLSGMQRPEFEKSVGGKGIGDIDSAPRDVEIFKTSDNLIYCVDSRSMSFWIRRNDSWICLLSDVYIDKTFGGMPAILPVRYLGKGLFAFTSTAPGKIDGRSQDGFPQAMGITYLLDSKSGEIVARSESFVYDQNPPVNVPKGWFEKYSLPATTKEAQ